MPPKKQQQEPSFLRRQLAEELTQLRSRTRLAMRPFADLVYPRTDPNAKPAQFRVQRVENGRLLPTMDEVERWLDAAEAPQEDRARVLEVARVAHAEKAQWAELLKQYGGRHLNALAAGDERSAALNCSYQQMIVPGLAQTEAYAAAALPHFGVQVELKPHLAGLADRQRILGDDAHQFRFILTRRAWTWNPAPDTVSMDAQHDKLRELAQLPDVDVRVLDDTAAPMGGYSSFTIYADRRGELPDLVVVELEHNRIPTISEQDVATYRARFEQLWAAAEPVGDVAQD